MPQQPQRRQPQRLQPAEIQRKLNITQPITMTTVVTVTFRSVLLIVALLVGTALAWGPSVQNSRRQQQRHTSSELRLRWDDDDDDDATENENDTDVDVIEAYRARLLGSHQFEPLLAEGWWSEDNRRVRDEFASLEGIVAEDPTWMETAFTSCGEDCEECEIPDDWAVPEDERFDVFEFLGIRRAEPLRVKTQGSNTSGTFINENRLEE